MAAPVHNSGCWSTHKIYKHHEQQKVCISRPKYRDGRRAKAVKVYTINLESRYLMVQGVPAIGVMTELIQLCALYGVVEEYRPLDEYPAEEFTEVYLVKFQKLTNARAAKRHMDEKSFYGGVLHVCYVPEYETLEDTRLKLQDRRRYVIRTIQNKAREKSEEVKKSTPPHTSHTAEKNNLTIDESSPSNNTAETCSTGHYFGFSLLPLPPQEDYLYKYNTPLLPVRTVPTEDKMGSLHNVPTDTQQKAIPQSQSSQTSCNTDRVAQRKVNPNRANAVRFVPRTTQLANRKRKMEEANSQLFFNNMEKTEPLIGPKLPDPPKLDMEDTSLNTTVDLIRNTMRQVAVPDVKAVEKKVKPRRRI